MFRILAITATLLGIASVAQADVYRWIDAHGTVQYSDRWVPGSTLVKTDKNHPSQVPSPAAPAAAAAPADAPPADPAEREREKRSVQQEVAKSRAEDCKKATEQYNQAIASRRIYKTGANGEKNFLPDAEADAYRLQLREARKQACGN